LDTFLVKLSWMMPLMITVSPLFTRTVVFVDRFVQVGPTEVAWARVRRPASGADASW